jgi:hypothetical protein
MNYENTGVNYLFDIMYDPTRTDGYCWHNTVKADSVHVNGNSIEDVTNCTLM